MLTLSLARGASRDFDAQLVLDDGGDAADVFQPSDALACAVWAGDDQETLVAPAIAWIDAAAGTLRIRFDDADTADLDPQIYLLRATATRAGRTAEVLRAYLQIGPAPGSATAPLTWCSSDDLARYAAWLPALQGPSDTSGFAEQRARATQWAIDTALARTLDVLDDQHRRHAPRQPAQFAVPPAGVDLGPAFGRSTYWEPNLRADLDQMRTWLNTAGTVVLESRLVEAVARMAIALVCDPQLGERDGTSYQALAATYRTRAIHLLYGYDFRILTPSDTNHPERLVAG